MLKIGNWGKKQKKTLVPVDSVLKLNFITVISADLICSQPQDQTFFDFHFYTFSYPN